MFLYTRSVNILAFDQKLLLWSQQILGRSGGLDWLLKGAAVYLVYLFPLILVVCWFWSETLKKTALRAFFAGIISWLGIVKTISLFYFRPRPFTAQIGAKELVFHRPDYSFPSDHAALIFAVSLTFYLFGYRKLGAVLFLISLILITSRVVVGVHYPTDVLAGALIGLVIAWLGYKLKDWVEKWLVNPVINLARRFYL